MAQVQVEVKATRYGSVRLLGQTFYYDERSEYTPQTAAQAKLFQELIDTAEGRQRRKLTKQEVIRIIELTEKYG